jgi:4'-phosphopantetheinyl transferase
LLGRYLQIPPDQIQFEYGPYGKPSLVGEPVEFNLSQSQGLALYGFSRRQAIGIDVEWLRPVPQLLQIAKRYFSTQDYATLKMLESDQQIRQFFYYWTRKEAHLKAIGTGLSQAKPAANKGSDLDPAEGWQAELLVPDAGAIATLVAQGQDWSLSCWDSPLT